MALAGGVSIHAAARRAAICYRGRRHRSRRTATAARSTRRRDGTVFGNGVGVVVLKRLDDALADGDTIHAVIRGSAINNDGARQGRLHGAERRRAGRGDRDGARRSPASRPDTIGYIEAHGTGTALGDPIEIAALTQAFRARRRRRGFCALGSVKTNIGHLDAAAGVAGLIKAALALRARRHSAPVVALRDAEPGARPRDARRSSSTRRSRRGAASDRPRRAGVQLVRHRRHQRARRARGGADASTPSAASRAGRLLVLSARTADGLECRDGATGRCDLSTIAEHRSRRRRATRCRSAAAALPIAGSIACRDSGGCRRRAARRDRRSGSCAITRGHGAPRDVVFMFPGRARSTPAWAPASTKPSRSSGTTIDALREVAARRIGRDLRELLRRRDLGDRCRRC